MNLADAPEVLTVEQARQILNVGRGTLYQAIREGQIPSVRIGRCIRIPRHALEQLLGGHGSVLHAPIGWRDHLKDGAPGGWRETHVGDG